MASDSDYELGEPSHLVEGNEGRLLDARRTPIRITAIMIETGQFELEILDFEDRGARWVEEFEQVNHYQFANGSQRRSSIESISKAIEKYDRQLSIPAASCPPLDLTVLRKTAAPLMKGLSFDFAAEVGCKQAWVAMREYMTALHLDDMEEAFAAQYVSNPRSGELIKGHRLLFAELGLVPYEGKVVRDQTIFTEGWNRQRRAKHICARLAFIREMFAQANMHEVLLWRGISTTTSVMKVRNTTFVSTSCSPSVAESLFAGSKETRAAVLARQVVPIERIFMTYIETEAMNRQFLESEAVLMFDADNQVF